MFAYIKEYNLSHAKNNIIKHAELDWSDQSEPYSTQYDDIYFNNDQGVKESQYVFFEGNQLIKRWLDSSQAQFCIAETGFGSGLNFINTAVQFLTFTKTSTKLKRLHFISFEKHPFKIDDLISTLKKFPQFEQVIEPLIAQYPLPLVGCHRLSFNDGRILLDLWFGDVNEQINHLTESQNGIIDAWYLDGFNPSKNPEMWNNALFKKMFALCKANATLATFTAAGFVRRALIEAGFQIQKRKGHGKKREMLVGSVNKTSSLTDGSDFNQDIAIIGGGIAALCSALSLAQRGNQVTLYCKDKHFASAASGNLQGALYPLINQDHDSLSQLFCNAYLYALNFYQQLNQQFPFAHQFDGLIQLAYDNSAFKKLKKIQQAALPEQLVHWIEEKQTNQLAGIEINHSALFYPHAGWLSPRQMGHSLYQKLKQLPNVTLLAEHHIEAITQQTHNPLKQWKLTAKTLKNSHQPSFEHQTIIIAAGFDSIKFEQCKAVPLSAARGQVSHITSTPKLSQLKRTICHEGYLTPALDRQHCMGATFKRHDENIEYRPSEQTDNHKKLKKCVANQAWVDSIILNDQAHTAIRCTTRDHFPYLGQLTDYSKLKSHYQQGIQSIHNLPDIYLFTGLGSRGLCSAPLLAEILASKINNESLPIAKQIVQKMKIPRQWINYMNKNKPLKV